MDKVDITTRSKIMSSVKQKNTWPEVIVCKLLFKQGFRFRKNVKSLPGSPDIVLPKYKSAIFVNGCFWHGHSCKAGRIPKTRTDFWNEKISSNRNRDLRKELQLQELGWKTFTVWQCDLKKTSDAELTVARLSALLIESYSKKDLLNNPI